MLSCPCAPGARAAVASTGWQSRLSSAVAVATCPTAFCQDVPASTARRIACQQCCRLHWAQHRLQCSSSARLWAAVCVPGGIWPFGGQNALRRPKKVKKAMEAHYNQDTMPCCCCVILEAANESPQFQSARPPLSTTPYITSHKTHGYATLNATQHRGKNAPYKVLACSVL